MQANTNSSRRLNTFVVCLNFVYCSIDDYIALICMFYHIKYILAIDVVQNL